jgi:hypothetical protein
LRRLDTVDAAGDQVAYDGELTSASGKYRVLAVVSLSDGAVRFETRGVPAPPFLLEVARTTLRVAWNAHRAGVAWPRRLSRWRGEPETRTGT